MLHIGGWGGCLVGGLLGCREGGDALEGARSNRPTACGGYGRYSRCNNPADVCTEQHRVCPAGRGLT